MKNITMRFSNQYNKYKQDIIEEIINEMGEEYRSVIEERINGTIMIFQSTPIEDYIYANSAKGIKFFERLLIKEEYRKFKKAKDSVRKNIMQVFKWMIITFFKIDKDIVLDDSVEELVSLFGDENFDSSYIDSCSLNSLRLLYDDETPQSVKDSILYDQKVLRDKLSKYGINIDDSFISKIDSFIERRDTIKSGYYRQVLQSNPSYTKSLSKYLETTEPQILFKISFYKNIHHAVFRKNEELQSYIFYPMTRSLNQNTKALDTHLIHELLHSIATINYIDNGIINEINVQRLAIIISRRLHEKNIFIFDNPNDYKIEGECEYEGMLPLIESMLSKYDSLFKACIINNNYYDLIEVFGESWVQLMKRLDELYYQAHNYSIQNGVRWCYIPQKDIYDLIQEIDSFYNRGERNV